MGASINGIRHLTKGSGQNPKYRGGGSIGIIGAARAAFLLQMHRGEKGVHVMAPIKGNLWRGKPDALEYVIEEKGESTRGHMAWQKHLQCAITARPGRIIRGIERAG